MKYNIIVYEEITDAGVKIENATLDNFIEALNRLGKVSILIYDENNKLVFTHYHEKLG